MNATDTTEFLGQEKISKILFKLATPVMFAQLIQALYNIVDSLLKILSRGQNVILRKELTLIKTQTIYLRIVKIKKYNNKNTTS